MLTLLWQIPLALLGLWMIIAIGSRESKQQRIDGAHKAGRGALWIACPPIGLWRSVRHGRRQSEDRLAEKIADKLR